MNLLIDRYATKFEVFSFPGEGVVGIEDDYLVTDKGLTHLTLREQTRIRIS